MDKIDWDLYKYKVIDTIFRVQLPLGKFVVGTQLPEVAEWGRLKCKR